MNWMQELNEQMKREVLGETEPPGAWGIKHAVGGRRFEECPDCRHDCCVAHFYGARPEGPRVTLEQEPAAWLVAYPGGHPPQVTLHKPNIYKGDLRTITPLYKARP